MTDHRPLYRRLLRRETHASRSVPTVVVALLLLVVVAWAGTESALAALGRPALLASLVDLPATLAATAADAPALVLAVGAATALVGLVLLVLALAPGRRGRHAIDDERVAAVVDDEVVAAAAARRARTAGRLGASQVRAWVSRRRVGLDLVRSSGVALDDEAVLAAVRDDLASIAWQPPLEVTARVERRGRIGA